MVNIVSPKANWQYELCLSAISEIIAGRDMINKNCCTRDKCIVKQHRVAGELESVAGG